MSSLITKGTDRCRPWIEAGLLTVAVAAGFHNCLPNGFVFDDRKVIVENKKVTRQDWSGIWLGPSWFPDKDDLGWRPLTTTTFAADWLWHGRNPSLFRLNNLLLHTANSWLVVRLAGLTGFLPAAGLFAGLLFALHPVHTETLNSIVGRADLLATLFFLLSCRSFLRKNLYGATLCFALGLLAKESAVTFLLLIPVLHLCLNQGKVDRSRLAREGLAFALVLLCYIAVRDHLIGKFRPGVGHIVSLDNPIGNLSFLPRCSNALYVLWRYVLLLLAPLKLSADYSFNSIPVLGVLAPRNLFAASFLAAGSVGLWRWAKESLPARFAIFFFALNCILVSNIFIPIGTIMAERLMYLPSVGFCLGLALALLSVERRAAVALLGAILVGYATVDVSRNKDWKDDATIFLRTTETSPDSVRAMVNASQGLLDRKNFERARDLLLRALQLEDRYPLPYSNLGLAYLGLGNLAAAQEAFTQALRRDPEYLDAQVNIGILFAKERRFDGAIAAFEKALLQEPEAVKLHYNLALACKQKGEVVYLWGQRAEAREVFRKAQAHYAKALALQPDYSEARAGLRALEPWLMK